MDHVGVQSQEASHPHVQEAELVGGQRLVDEMVQRVSSLEHVEDKALGFIYGVSVSWFELVDGSD